jgi:hypothetical protein
MFTDGTTVSVFFCEMMFGNRESTAPKRVRFLILLIMVVETNASLFLSVFLVAADRWISRNVVAVGFTHDAIIFNM